MLFYQQVCGQWLLSVRNVPVYSVALCANKIKGADGFEIYDQL